jgi:hypothetical protein
MSGYSGTPLVKKLGFKSGMIIHVLDAPNDYETWFVDLPADIVIVKSLQQQLAAVHLFATDRNQLKQYLEEIRRRLDKTGFVWVSWPKKSAKVPTDVTEDVIRDVALPMGFVDIKVCSVSDIWSGLKLVIRKTER